MFNTLKIKVMAKKFMASAAKKSAKIVKMTVATAVATMCTNCGMDAAATAAAKQAYEDMAQEYGEHAIIIEMNPFGGFIA